MTVNEYEQEVRRVRMHLLTVARHYVGDECEDVVQDALLRLWQMRDELSVPVDALARVVVRHLCIDRLRRRKVHDDDLVDVWALSETEMPWDTDPADEMVRQQIDRMMAVMATLPDMQQMVLRLRHMDGMTMADIARLTGSTEVAVRKSLSRARMAVRDLMVRPKE